MFTSTWETKFATFKSINPADFIFIIAVPAPPVALILAPPAFISPAVDSMLIPQFPADSNIASLILISFLATKFIFSLPLPETIFVPFASI